MEETGRLATAADDSAARMQDQIERLMGMQPPSPEVNAAAAR